MPTWLITGASRGIGLSTIHYLLKDEANQIIATSRSESDDLNTLALKHPQSLKVFLLDITSQQSVDEAVAKITPLLPNGLDYLVNNAGQNPQPTTTFEDADLDLFAEEMTLSTVAPLRVSRAFLPLIKQSQLKRIIFLSSVTASSQISYQMVGQYNTYSVAKAALNMLARKWGASLRFQGVITAAIHPGWTRTEMGAPIKAWMDKYAPHVPYLTTDEAAMRLVKTCEGLTMKETASYWHFDGSKLPW
ncbi:NAD(P)-binding protein [Agrocybe pediades]|nr:NAD(P)-binding protein [Agrocybe pediades]